MFTLPMTINGNTQLAGLIGWPVDHSLSPAMHNAAAADLGLNLVYVPLPVASEHLAEAVRGLPALGFSGVNVTIPHKEAVLAYMDESTADVEAIGAVNTILIDSRTGALQGHNTDWTGFLTHLDDLGVSLTSRDCLVLGAGGAARAIVYAAVQSGSRVFIFARRVKQARILAADLNRTTMGNQPVQALSLAGLAAAIETVDQPLIINATPLGLPSLIDQSPWPNDLPFPKGSFVYDLVYNPTETLFMRQAEAAECPTANGLGLLVNQAAQSFELWTGTTPSLVVMEQALESAYVNAETYGKSHES